ncbi:MAG: hypothetical protein QOD75_3089 [Blastocatellia bacterium]|jgi:hypothetical protein|nr:hypothetical protein [Blastocatellia bacterium]
MTRAIVQNASKPTSGKANINRTVAVVLLLSLVAAACIWFYVTWSTPPAAPVLFPPLSTPDKTTYIVSGLAEPNVEVVVKVPGSADLITQADGTGIFHTQILLPQVGEYTVSTQSKNRRGETSPLQSFKLSVGEKAAAPVLISRNVVMLARFRSLVGYVEIVLPPVQTSWLLQESDVIDAAALSRSLKECGDPLSKYLRNQVSQRTRQLLDQYKPAEPPTQELLNGLMTDLRAVQASSSMYDKPEFSIDEITRARDSEGEDPVRLNRMLLEHAYPTAIAKVSIRPGYKLVTGSQKLSEFLHETFSTASLTEPGTEDSFSIRTTDPTDLGTEFNLFKDGSEQIVVTPSFTVVRSLSCPFTEVLPVGYEHLLQSTVVFDTRWKSIEGARDTFSILARDYFLSSVNELPTLSTKEQALWNVTHQTLTLPDHKATDSEENESDDAQKDDSSDSAAAAATIAKQVSISQPTNIVVTLSYRPLEKPENLFKLARLSPYDLVSKGKRETPPFSFSFNSWSLVTLGLSTLFTLPILWISFLFRDKKKIKLILNALVAAVMVPAIFYLANSLSSAIYAYDGYKSGQFTDLRFMVPSLILIPILACVFFLVLKLFLRKHVCRHGLKTLFIGITYAAAFWLVLLSIMEFVQRFAALSDTTAVRVATALAFWFLVAILLACKRCFENVRDKSFLVGPKILILIPLVAALAYPYYLSTGADPEQALKGCVQSFFSSMLVLIPYLALLTLLVSLRKQPARIDVLGVKISIILFAAFLVGTPANWLMVPIPFLLALWVYPKFVLAPPDTLDATDLLRSQVLTLRNQIIEGEFSESVSPLLQKSLANLGDKIAAGEIQKAEFEARRTIIEQLMKDEDEKEKFPDGTAKRDVMLNFGPFGNNWENAIWAVKISFIFVVPFILFESWRLLQVGWEPEPYSHLFFLSRIMAHAANWLVGAFFFGYFFPYLQGENGIKKSTRVSLAVVLCLLPIWLLITVTPSALILRAAQTFFFFAALGMLFDYYTVSFKLRTRSDWKNFVRLVDMPSLTPFVSALVGMIGVGLTAAVTGEFKGLFTQAIEITIKQLPNLKF